MYRDYLLLLIRYVKVHYSLTFMIVMVAAMHRI